MATELGLLSLTQFQKLAQSQQNQNQHHHRHQPDPNLTAGSWMWNPKAQSQEALADDDSWEVRAFAEDTGNVMGTTWPPRFYTCTFCKREFRSAQALGGHMNVHRRDRARLLQTQPGTGALINPSSSSSTTTTTSSSTLLIPTQEFATNGGLCLLYQLPNPNGVFTSPPMNGCPIDSPSTLLSISPYPSYNMMAAAPSINFSTPSVLSNSSSSHCYSTKAEPSPKLADNTLNQAKNIGSSKSKETSIEELDLELRLGYRPTTS